ncbi:MAG: hypothetical protein IPJ30_13750 [Acidobacteria bacterium]|nr:hypothetical protein [Acidobacteriota bacterium]
MLLFRLIPILGRPFTALTKDNRQVDIIAITPRVIRAPTILPEDIIERLTGGVATPTSGSLEAMLIQDEINEQLPRRVVWATPRRFSCRIRRSSRCRRTSGRMKRRTLRSRKR